MASVQKLSFDFNGESLENAHRHTRQQNINRKFFCGTPIDVPFVAEKE